MESIRTLKKESLRALQKKLLEIEQHVLSTERSLESVVGAAESRYRESVRNLIHYLALRQLDLRDLQMELARLGLSSLGRSEGHVLANLREVAERTDSPVTDNPLTVKGAIGWDHSEECLRRHTLDLFGKKPRNRHAYIMVTAPDSEIASESWMESVLAAGMNCLRINCAHGEPEEWRQIIDRLNAVKKKRGVECRILMDLPGPKLRTSAFADGPAVQYWKAGKDAFGRATAQARIPLVSASLFEKGWSEPAVILPDESMSELKPGDILEFKDPSSKKRKLRIEEVREGYASALSEKTVYIEAGAELRHLREDRKLGTIHDVRVPRKKTAIEARPDDPMILSGEPGPGKAEVRDITGKVISPGVVACSIPSVLHDLKAGERVLFDDGKIECQIEGKSGSSVRLHVLRVKSGKANLKEEKGINFPDSKLSLSGLTQEDRDILPFIAAHADIVALSFVRDSKDIREFLEHFRRQGRPELGLILKIETQLGFENLPTILFEAMTHYPVGVMIARGDLAVECGFERLAELQEEILWFCEAAHIPVVWATQVLENLAQTGFPTRAEVTDAAMSVRAECAMLNKGPFIETAIKCLDDILCRMEQHQHKKKNLYRQLKVSLQKKEALKK